jgi:2-dehydropantoate 2-reductase
VLPAQSAARFGERGLPISGAWLRAFDETRVNMVFHADASNAFHRGDIAQTTSPVALPAKPVETVTSVVVPNRTPSTMRICIFGAGAVGSHFAVRLALAGHDVSCVMRGPHLEATKANGLTLRVGGADVSARVNVSDDPAALGPQDFVISTLKANALDSLVTGLPPLLRDDTAVVFAQNGIPWWYDIGLAPDHPAPPDLGFLDPGGRLRAVVSKARIIGGVIFSSNEIVAPGVVANLSPDRNMLLVGECDDRASPRIERLRATLNEAAIASPQVARIREAIWSKLLTNMSMSVLCLLTGQTARAVRDDPSLRDVVPRLLDEANSIGQSCFPDVKRVTRTGPAPDHKPSILQDYELGRPMEIDALVRAPAAFARAAGLSTPMLDLLAGLAIRQGRDKGL